MSKILENKQIIHIATEIVALTGIVFYFSSKNSKLLKQIEELNQRLKEQEEISREHNIIINELVQFVKKGYTQKNTKIDEKKKKTSSSNKPREKNNTKNVTFKDNEDNEDNEDVDEKITPPTEKVKPIEKKLHNTPIVIEEEYSSDDESDLDADIADELSELK
jgi:hypothetical protein